MDRTQPDEQLNSQSRNTTNSEYWTTFDDGLSIETTSAHSTNSTVSGLPGPGRTLDHVLGILGRKLESALPKAIPRPPDDSEFTLERTSTHSANSTVSNQPGPGRTLDHLLGIWGRKLEAWLAKKTHKIGLGPHATSSRLKSRSAQLSGDLVPFKEAKKMVKDCQKLLKYMETSQTLSTRCHAMANLYSLATNDVRLQQFFIMVGAYPYLQCMHHAIMRDRDDKIDRFMLLSACRQALVSVEENMINITGKELSHLLVWSEARTAGSFAEAVVLWLRLYLFLWKNITRSFELPEGPASTEEHVRLADAYWNVFKTQMESYRAADEHELTLFLRAMTRCIYECMACDDRLPPSCVLSPVKLHSYYRDGGTHEGSMPKRRRLLESADAAHLLDLTGRLLVSKTFTAIEIPAQLVDGVSVRKRVNALKFTFPFIASSPLYLPLPEKQNEDLESTIEGERDGRKNNHRTENNWGNDARHADNKDDKDSGKYHKGNRSEVDVDEPEEPAKHTGQSQIGKESDDDDEAMELFNGTMEIKDYRRGIEAYLQKTVNSQDTEL